MKLTYSVKKVFFTGVSMLLLGSSAFAQDSVTTFSSFELQPIPLPTSSFLNFELKPIPLPTSSFSSFELQPIQLSNLYFPAKDVKSADMAISPWEKRIGITGAFGEGATSMTLGFSHLYGFGSSRRFKMGYGLRLSSFFGSDRKFTAAPPDLASQDNPQYFGVGDTFFGINDEPSNSQLNAVNLGLYTEYSITENVLVGFNIDVIGFSFGAEKDGTVYDNAAVDGLTIISSTSAKPTSFNALLVGNNDIGTLNSEFWIGYKIASNLLVKGAFSYLFTEYTTEGQYQDGNDRFRYKAAQGAIGVSYIF